MSVNKVILIGNVGQEPEVRHMDNNITVATLSLATTERGYTLPNGTQVPERTDWHNIVLWRGLADVVEKYVHKGDKLYIEGKLRPRTYDDKNGMRRYTVEVIADNMEMLSGRRDGGANQGGSQAQQTAPQVAQAAQAVPQAPQQNPTEDLPF
jgi:single-strand DNA-binding protein